MPEDTHQQIDYLFSQIRLRLLQVRDSAPTAVEELKSLLIQLEDCVESLVIDSLKLKSLEARPKKATESEKRPTKRPSKKKKTR